MGRREWEEGNFTLPKAEWVKFRKAMVEAYNAGVHQDFETTQRVYEAVKSAVKGKRGVDLATVIRDVMARTKPGHTRGFALAEPEFTYVVVNEYQAQRSLQKKDEVTGKLKLQAPKKQLFELAKQTTMGFDTSDGSRISLAPDTQKVNWEVPESKGACECSRQSLMGSVLFKLLAGVNWTRGSGGWVSGNDEYHEDAGRHSTGAGGSYLKERFGPLGDQEFERVHGRPPAPKPRR